MTGENQGANLPRKGKGVERFEVKFEEYPPPLMGEDKGGGEKVNITPHPNPLPQGERELENLKNFLPLDGGGLRWG